MTATADCRLPTRRRFLSTGAALIGGALGWPVGAFARSSEADGLAFFVIADTHVLAQAEDPAIIAPHSLALNERLIHTLNELPGAALPPGVGGGTVARPAGVIHLGDLIDSGDKLGDDKLRMARTEWSAYTQRYGVTGKDGLLRYPLYEVHGNHDTPRAYNVTLQGLAARNAKRPGVTSISRTGLHYGWDWGDIRFVALGIVVGPNREDLPVSRYDSYDSLAFLVEDLRAHVGDSGRPVILLQHVDLQRYSLPVDESLKGGSRDMCCEGMARIAWHGRDCPARAAGISMSEWSAADVRAYHRAIQPYNVVAIFHGHLHARRIDTWDGRVVDAPRGIPVFGAKNAGAGGSNRAFFYCRVERDRLVVREYQSIGEEGWDLGQSDMRWEPRTWHAPLFRG